MSKGIKVCNDAGCRRIKEFPGFNGSNGIKHNADARFRWIKKFPGARGIE